MKMLTSVLMCFGISSILAVVLPSEFGLQNGPQGPTLTWSSKTVPIHHVGGSRFEFRLEDGTVLGYPRAQRGALQLSLSSFQFQALTAQKTASLQVWAAGRRLDTDAPTNVFRSSQFAAAAAAPVSSTLSTPTVPTDPAKNGTLATQRRTYTVASLNVTGFPVLVEVVGEVTFPKNDPVKHPLILFLHGRHSSCYQGGANGETLDEWPCPDGWLPIPSYQGYRYVADILASQGNIVVSISANAISPFDFYIDPDLSTKARSALIHHHLSLWAQWNANGGAPFGNPNRFKGRLDMNKVVLVGHDHGGEAVHRAAIDASSSDLYKIVGLVTYGATSRTHPVTPDVHSVNILPTCDVNGQPGQFYVDASRDIAYSEALRSAVISVGSNNNYFNTEWTPGLAVAPASDDWDDFYLEDPLCNSQGGSLRLTHDQQRKVGAAYTVALIKLAIYQDVSMLPLLDGSFVRPAAIVPAEVAVNAVGGAKNRLLYRPEDSGQPILSNGMTGNECMGNYLWSGDMPLCEVDTEYFSGPHWDSLTSRPSPQALELQWANSVGSAVRFNVNSTLRDLFSLDSLDVRIANHPFSSGVSFDLMVVDNSGKSAKLPISLTTIESWPYTYNVFPRVHARTLRGSLQSVKSSGVNLKQVAAVILVSQNASGHVWIIDIAASQARIQVPTVLDLPKLSIGSATVRETDGFKQYTLNIVSDHPLSSKGSFWLENIYNYVSVDGRQVDIAPSSSTVVRQIKIDHAGDNIFSSPLEYEFRIEAIKGVVTGDHHGYLNIEENDPFPSVSVAPLVATAKEGESLTWNLKLSAPATSMSFLYSIVPPTSGTELTTQDVPASWLSNMGIFQLPSTPKKLSELQLSSSVAFGYGVTEVQLTIPLSKDGKAEGNEIVAIELVTEVDPDYNPMKTILLTGRVLAHT